MKITNTEWMVGRHGGPLMPVRDQPGLSRFNEQPRILRESPMTPTKRRSKLQSIALAMLVALALSAGLVRGPTDGEVFAQALRDVAFGDSTILHPAAVLSTVIAENSLYYKAPRSLLLGNLRCEPRRSGRLR
jgi:hypothetical protein